MGTSYKTLTFGKKWAGREQTRRATKETMFFLQGKNGFTCCGFCSHYSLCADGMSEQFHFFLFFGHSLRPGNALMLGKRYNESTTVTCELRM